MKNKKPGLALLILLLVFLIVFGSLAIHDLSPFQVPDRIWGMSREVWDILLVGVLFAIFFIEVQRIFVPQRKSEESSNSWPEYPISDGHGAPLGAEKLHQGLFENMMHGFIYCQVLYDRLGKADDYIYLAVNHTYELFTGLKDLIGKKISNVIPGLNTADPALFETIGRVSTSGKPERFETFIQALERWYSVSMYCPEKGYFVALVDNITEEKTAEKKLKERELRFRTLIENNSEAIVLMDEDFKTTYRSPASERITGFAIHEMHPDHMDEHTHPDDISKVRNALAQALQHPRRPISVQFRTRHQEGNYIWIDGVITNLVSEPGIHGILLNYRDITAQKRLEDEQALFALIVNSSDDAILSKDLNGIITSWNLGAEKLFGYREAEIVGKNVSMLIPPDRLDEEPQIIKRIRRGERIDHYETKRLRKDGTSILISLTVSPIRDNHGNIIGASKIARDISERQEAKEKLETSERRFRALIENSSDAIVLNDENAFILYQSPSVKRILGYTQNERLGTPVSDYIHPDDLEGFIQLYNNLKKTEGHPLEFQYRFRRKNGKFIWLEGVVTNLLKDPSVKAIVANYRDITARKVAEESLELTISRFRQAQQIAHLGHWELDFETLKTNWSDETFRIFGLEPGAAEPSEELFLSFVHPGDIERVSKEIEHSRQVFTPFSLYHRILLRSGNIKVLLSVGRYEFDKLEKPLRLYGISLDVTELNEKEEKLKEVNKDLETFIYRSSHDLRSPIASILGLINVAKSDITDTKALNYFDMVNEVVLRQNRMLLNLIQVMSIRTKQLAAEPVNPEEIMSEVLSLLKSMKGFEKVKIDLQTRVTSIHTDRQLFTTILFQLLENAILYANGTDSIAHVRMARDEQGEVLLEVQDNGIGIPERSLERVFDMFYRGCVLSKGSGLGLYLVRTAVNRMGGSVKVFSEELKGSTFVIKLPAEFSGESIA
jgi:PAS domain S-box-containing protein